MIRNLVPREYQKNIAKSALEKNTLVVLPTGMGKTIIALLVSVERLKKYPDSKILIMAPTRPLAAQHKKTFEKFTTIDKDLIILVTGRIKPENRMELYEKAKIITATPQTIKNDVESGRLKLDDFSLLVIDEAHRAVKDYPYPYIAKKYVFQSKHPLILALTASPGATKNRIEEIMNNIFIRNLELRSEEDEDVRPYVKEIKKEYVYIKFPEELKEIRNNLKKILDKILDWLKEHRFIPNKRIPKKNLIALQKRIATSYMKGNKNPVTMWGMIKISQAIKIIHALDVLETQELEFFYEYLKKISNSKKRTDKIISKDNLFIECLSKSKELLGKNFEHPKMIELVRIVKKIIDENSGNRIIIFANYRNTVEKIKQKLDEIGIESRIFIGQSKKSGTGMSQKEQIKTIEEFREKKFNVLIATSIGEEGLDIPSVEYAIFYEAVPSEIRMIQRKGRVGRQSVGEVIFLITKGTADEAYFYAALRKEKKMGRILKRTKKHGIKRKDNLLDWVVK